MKKFFSLLALVALWALPAAAQNTTGLVTTTCGTISPVYLAGRPAAFVVDVNGNLCISGTISASNPSVASTGAAVPASGTYIAASKSGTLTGLTLDASSYLNVNCQTGCAGGAQSNASSGLATSADNGKSVAWLYGFNGTTWDQLQVDGSKFLKVILQTGSTSAVTQATASNLNATVVGTGTFAVQAAQSGSWTLAANQSVNVAQINGVTPLMGNGTTGTGSQRVTIASDNTAFSVNATLSAETTKVIGTVRVLGNAGAVFDAATGAAVPANGLFVGLSDGTNLRGWLNAANALNSTGAGIGTAQAIGQFDDTSPTSITENQFGNLRMSANRNLYGTIRDAAGNERGANVDASNRLSVSVDAFTATNASVNVAQMNGVAVTMGNGVAGTGVQRVAIASDNTAFSVNATLSAETTKVIGTVRALGNAGAIFDGVNTAATAPANGILGLGIYNSTEPSPTTGQSVGIQLDSKGRTKTVLYDAAGNTRGANVDASNRLSVSVDAFTATNASVNLAQVGGTNVVNGGVAGSQAVGGTVATNVAITSNPLNLGAQAVSSENTAVTTARQVQLVADLVGKLIVLPYANPENFVSGVTAAMTGTTSTSLIAAPAAGLRNYTTQLICTNSHASVGTYVLIQDGNAGTTIYEGYAASVGGGFSINFPTPLRQPTTATALFVQNVTTGANVICAGSGYKGA